jgi:hypothetical protein
MKKTIKSLLGYIGCIGIALAVTYYIDGTAGVILTTALICAFVFSLILTLAVKRFIRAEITVDRFLLTKKDTLKCIVKLSKKYPIPSSLVEIECGCSPNLSLAESKSYKAAIFSNRITAVEIPYSAKFSGTAEVKITGLRLNDFLGIFSFKLPIPEEQSSIKVSVYPDIPDVGIQTDFIRTASEFSGSDDDEEETDESSLNFTGMPGYEHRMYYPGDPIKKINWKLSSKRDTYMVRLDEKVSSAGQVFFLDAPLIEENDWTLFVRDNVIEGALAIFSMMVRDGRETTFFHYSGGLWLRSDIRTLSDIYQLQEQLASFAPSSPEQLIPPEIASIGKTPICFTTAVSERIDSITTICSQSPQSLVICAESANLRNISPNLWTVTSEFELKKQK